MTFLDSLIRWPLICCVCSLAMMSATAQGQAPLRDEPKERLVKVLEIQRKQCESDEQKRLTLTQQLEATQIEIESATKERIERDQAIAQ
jgi:hypothetical protein